MRSMKAGNSMRIDNISRFSHLLLYYKSENRIFRVKTTQFDFRKKEYLRVVTLSNFCDHHLPKKFIAKMRGSGVQEHQLCSRDSNSYTDLIFSTDLEEPMCLL